MVDRQRALLMALLALLIYPNDIFGNAYQPEFSGPITNLTVALGRDATFTCLVKHLGGYRVGWVKADTKAIQAIHDHVITHNERVSVSHSDHTMWHLHIKRVQKEDEGLYMCQINTDPMKSQTGMLSIVVPPDFVAEDTSNDVMVHEGGQVRLTCRARGEPPPRVTWRREDGKNITIREPFAGNALNQNAHVTYASVFQGEELNLTKISRYEMGVYLCIASNGVPPAVSKRISITVHFPPLIHVPNQLVGAPLGTDVALECIVEASPKAISYWTMEKGAMIVSSGQYDVQTIQKSQFEVRMRLVIRNFHKRDVGTYHCAAKNSLGDVDSSIRLYDMSGSTKTQTAAWPSFYDDEDNAVYGSAELDKVENRPLSVDTSGRGYGAAAGHPSVATPSPTVRLGKKRPTVALGSSADRARARPLSIAVTLLAIVLARTTRYRWH